MARFIARKKYNYSFPGLVKVIILLGMILFVVVNVIIMRFFIKNDQTSFLNIVSGNIYGNILPTSKPTKYQELLVRNIYGYNLDFGQLTGKNTNNIEELLVEDTDDLPLVYLYNTYQTDKYKSNYANSYNVNSLITQASLILKEYLDNEGIRTVVETNSVAKTLKDNNIPYTNSYRGSRILLEEAHQNNPSLKYFWDLALSDYDYETTTVNIENKSYAKILFIVGTDNANYHENQKLAQNLNDILNNIRPELSRGLSLRGGAGYHGVYNQDYQATVLQIQVGGKDNTIAEVNRSLKILANVISTYLKEEGYEEK